MEANGYFDKSLVKRVAVMEAAMAAAALPVIEIKEKVESMKVAKPKKVPVRKALEMTSMDVDGESKADQLLKQVKKSGITKKVSSTGKKLGKKDKQVFHMGKRTKEKKKAKRSASQARK